MDARRCAAWFPEKLLGKRPITRLSVSANKVSPNQIPQHEDHDVCVVQDYICTKFFSFIWHTIFRKPA